MNLSLMGEKIKAARVQKKLTLEKVSERIGISRNFLWEIEAGRKAPAIQTLYNIGKDLDISIDYLLGLSEHKKWLCENNDSDLCMNINRIIQNLNSAEMDILYKLLLEYLKNKK